MPTKSEPLQSRSGRTGLYLTHSAKWLLTAGLIGVLCGVIGSLFHMGVHIAFETLQSHFWLLFCAPLSGLLIVAIYKFTRAEGLGTDDVIEAVHHNKQLPIGLLPAIFFGTVLTHLVGGSSGREGAALQMGGTIGQNLGKVFHLDEQELRIATLCGMGAFFTALFGTPVTAVLFVTMVISVGTLYYAAFLPCMTSSLAALWVSQLMGVGPTRFALTAPAGFDLLTLGKVVVLSVLCAFLAFGFCHFMHGVGHAFQHYIPNPWIRVAAGGVVLIALTCLVGSWDYNGAGMGLIAAAIEEGTAHPAAFLLKALFTAVTLGSGFKGGEVVPSFFVGAAFGCVLAPFLGLPAGFAAAIGLIAVFCGCSNCPVASIALSIELFGADGLVYFAAACAISFLFSGYAGFYSSQTISYSKLKDQLINIHTNSTPTGSF